MYLITEYHNLSWGLPSGILKITNIHTVIMSKSINEWTTRVLRNKIK